jgi:uncharacterized protein YhbP (UPF0306 family)
VNDRDPAAIAKAIIDANSYLVLGTADEAGRPWASPVWYAHEQYTEFFWVSSPEARHSRNLSTRPEVGIVIFDSRQPAGTGQGAYLSAVAAKLAGTDVDRGIGVFSRRSVTEGMREWTLADVQPPARHRLYRATANEHFILGPRDQRKQVSIG